MGNHKVYVLGAFRDLSIKFYVHLIKNNIKLYSFGAIIGLIAAIASTVSA